MRGDPFPAVLLFLPTLLHLKFLVFVSSQAVLGLIPELELAILTAAGRPNAHGHTPREVAGQGGRRLGPWP